jgi:hypothetical protein
VEIYADSPDSLSNATVTGITHAIEADNEYLADTFGVNPDNLPFNVGIELTAYSGGTEASHQGCATTKIDITTTNDVGFAAALTAAEMVEVYEATAKNGWDCGHSNGEGLSRSLALQRHSELRSQLADSVTSWLQNGACDCISTNDARDVDDYSNGCSVIFLDYLHSGLGYSWKDIVHTGGSTLAETYSKLTGNDSSTAYQDFMKVLPSFTKGNFTDVLLPYVKNATQLEKGSFSCASKEGVLGFPEETTGGGFPDGAMVGIFVGGTALLGLAGAAWVFWRRRRQARARTEPSGDLERASNLDARDPNQASDTMELN